LLGQLKTLFIEDIAGKTSNGAREQKFRPIKLGLRLPPLEQELMETLAKQRDNRQHRAGLDDDVEKVFLRTALQQPVLGAQQPRHLQQLLSYNQVPCGGDRQKLGNAFDNTEQDDNKPNRHPG
jgi:hypothetical protein